MPRFADRLTRFAAIALFIAATAAAGGAKAMHWSYVGPRHGVMAAPVVKVQLKAVVKKLFGKSGPSATSPAEPPPVELNQPLTGAESPGLRSPTGRPNGQVLGAPANPMGPSSSSPSLPSSARPLNPQGPTGVASRPQGAQPSLPPSAPRGNLASPTAPGLRQNGQLPLPVSQPRGNQAGPAAPGLRPNVQLPPPVSRGVQIVNGRETHPSSIPGNVTSDRIVIHPNGVATSVTGAPLPMANGRVLDLPKTSGSLPPAVRERNAAAIKDQFGKTLLKAAKPTDAEGLTPDKVAEARTFMQNALKDGTIRQQNGRFFDKDGYEVQAATRGPMRLVKTLGGEKIEPEQSQPQTAAGPLPANIGELTDYLAKNGLIKQENGEFFDRQGNQVALAPGSAQGFRPVPNGRTIAPWDPQPSTAVATATATTPVRRALPTPPMGALPAPSASTQPAPVMGRLPAPPTSQQPSPAMGRLPPPPTSQQPSPVMGRLPPPPTSQQPSPVMGRLPPPPTSQQPSPVMGRLPPPPTSQQPSPVMGRLPPPPTSQQPSPVMGKLPARPTSQQPSPVMGKLPARPTSQEPSPVMGKLPARPTSQEPSPVMGKLPARPTSQEPSPVMGKLPAPPASRQPSPVVRKLPAPPKGEALAPTTTSVFDRSDQRTVINQLKTPDIGAVACGPTSCAMLLSDQGKTVDIKKLASDTRLDPTDGTIGPNLALALQDNGVGNARYEQGVSLAKLESATSRGASAIVFQVNPIGNIGHFVVVDGVQNVNGKDYVAVRDPWEGQRYSMPADVFEQSMSGEAVLTNPPSTQASP